MIDYDSNKPGTIFKVGETQYIALGRQRAKARFSALRPQPNEAGPEYTHDDGKKHVCHHPNCPNLTLQNEKYCPNCQPRPKEGITIE